MALREVVKISVAPRELTHHKFVGHEMEIDSIHHRVIYFYFVIYSTLFASLLLSKSIVHKYLPCKVSNCIQIYLIYNYISLIDLCLNYDY